TRSRGTCIAERAKKFQLVWVFETEKALDDFVNSGWEFGGQATAAAKAGDKGGAYQGAVAAGPGVWLYQVTKSGLALEPTAKGTKYFKERSELIVGGRTLSSAPRLRPSDPQRNDATQLPARSAHRGAVYVIHGEEGRKRRKDLGNSSSDCGDSGNDQYVR